jgi:DNA invertase Pin-like site-specific DNA recombinase
MNYGYIRVSTDKQTTKNQKFEIQNFAKEQNVKINEWTEETISATKKLDDRKFGHLLKKMQKGDQLIVTELSRLGRNLMQIMKILHDCMEKDIKVFTIKERYELGDNINSKVLAFAFGLSAEIERNLISQRTKEALARRRAEGVILGRPKGRKSDNLKLTGKEKEISVLLHKKISYSAIARILGVHRLTVATFVKSNNLNSFPM